MKKRRLQNIGIFLHRPNFQRYQWFNFIVNGFFLFFLFFFNEGESDLIEWIFWLIWITWGYKEVYIQPIEEGKR